jgi:hypothetical protein
MLCDKFFNVTLGLSFYDFVLLPVKNSVAYGEIKNISGGFSFIFLAYRDFHQLNFSAGSKTLNENHL